MVAAGKRFKKAQDITRSWSAARRQQLLQTPEIQELLTALELDKAHLVPVSTATVANVKAVTGFNFSANRYAGYSNWDLDALNPLPPVCPSSVFMDHLKRVNKWFNIAKAAVTRSILDAPILEAAEHFQKQQPDQKTLLPFFGEVSVSQYKPDKSLSRVTWTIWEAKNAVTAIGGRVMLPLLAYMAMVYGARRAARKSNAGIFGFQTNGTQWIFARIDNNGGVWQSPQYDNQPTVLRHLSFLLSCVKTASQTTTPFGSTEDLGRSALADAFENLPGYKPAIRTTIQERALLDVEVETYSLDPVGTEERDDDEE
ncbi:hypothetical protein HK104_011009 [Borealophlyctis nickersoniae]|nr:hypothetical protein HK104_011009 [Borealophlyctis nickersoniae]